MKNKIYKRQTSAHGFTIIEVMIVIAIGALILVIVALGASSAAKTHRDNYRKAYARQVFEALEDYYKSNGKFPGCDTSLGCNITPMKYFLDSYMPDGSDPLTGKNYHSAPSIINAADAGYYGNQGMVESASGAAVFVDNGIYHNVKPKVGQIIIGTAHWCFGTTGFDPNAAADPADAGPPLAGAKKNPVTNDWDQDFSKFSILIYQERGGYFCLDNYVRSGDPLETP
jgi:prepilin-type N-terminal cleavage/methylation domain-containing protein